MEAARHWTLLPGVGGSPPMSSEPNEAVAPAESGARPLGPSRLGYGGEPPVALVEPTPATPGGLERGAAGRRAATLEMGCRRGRCCAAAKFAETVGNKNYYFPGLQRCRHLLLLFLHKAEIWHGTSLPPCRKMAALQRGLRSAAVRFGQDTAGTVLYAPPDCPLPCQLLFLGSPATWPTAWPFDGQTSQPSTNTRPR